MDFWYNKNMTGKTREYLADLANRKGVLLPVGFEESSQAVASAKIEELKALPDASFPELSESDRAESRNAIAKIKQELAKWTFEK